MVLSILEYRTRGGRSPFSDWFAGLDAVAAAKVTVAISRMEHDNLSNAKSLGAGIQELRIHFGPGYRVYFGRDGDMIVILLGGGTKKRQRRDIVAARDRWQDYRRRKMDF
jgi:putative addiction module killer protein